MGCFFSDDSTSSSALPSRTWPPEYPRPMVLRDGSSILLLNENHEFCSQPPFPFPDWLTARGITPAAWLELVWTINFEFDNARSRDPGRFATGSNSSDQTQIMPRVSAVVAAYVTRIAAPKWASRGLRIEYIEGPLVDVRPGRSPGSVRCRMDNRLLFSPMSSPAPERPSVREVNQCRLASTGKAIWLRDLELNRGVRVPHPGNAPVAQATQNPTSNSGATVTSTSAATTQATTTSAEGHEIAQSAPSGFSFPTGSTGGPLVVAARVSTPPETATAVTDTAEVDAMPVVVQVEGAVASGVPISAVGASDLANAPATVGEWKTGRAAPLSCPSCSVSLQVFLEDYQPRFCPHCAAPLAQR